MTASIGTRSEQKNVVNFFSIVVTDFKVPPMVVNRHDGAMTTRSPVRVPLDRSSGYSSLLTSRPFSSLAFGPT